MKAKIDTNSGRKILGLRERNKSDKLDRIRRATLTVLDEKGYEKTTIREIALRAGVGHGTIFSYSRDKVELCLICIQEELDELGISTFKKLRPAAPVSEQVVEYLSPRYAYWERYRALFFAATQQLTGKYDGDIPPELGRAKSRRAQTQGRVAEILERGKANNEIGVDVDVDAVSRILLDVYLQELRFWLNDDQVELKQGVQQLEVLVKSIVALIQRRYLEPVRRTVPV